MKSFESRPYSKTIRLRIAACWTAIVLMTVYMIVLVELGGGDSRMMTRTADLVTDLLYFGGVIFLGVRIHRNKKLLKNRLLLREQQEAERGFPVSLCNNTILGEMRAACGNWGENQL